MKRTYVTLIIVIILLSLLAACANDTGIHTDTSLPQQSEPMPSPTGWPVAYSSMLEEYKTLAELIYHDDDYSFFDFIADSDDAYEWQKQNMPDLDIVFELVIDGSRYRERDELGYALKDLNGDGNDELILLSKGYWVFAVYSTADGKPKLVDSYADRYRCEAIDGSGLFYIYGSDGADDWSYGIYQLSDDGSELLLVAEYGMESQYSYDWGEGYPEAHYYKVIDGKSYSEREIITEAEFDEFYENHPAFADDDKAAEITKSAVVFIPILD